MKPILLPVVAGCVLFLGSCIDIDANITINDAGAGSVELVYTVSPEAVSLENAERDDAFLPFPVDEADFRRTVLAVPGLSLKSYARSAAGDAIVVTAVLDFANIAALNRFVGGNEEIFTLRKENAGTVFTQTLTRGSAEELDPRAKSFLAAFFKPYRLSFSVAAPKPVKRAVPENGVVSGREARISYPLVSLIEAREPVVWRIEW